VLAEHTVLLYEDGTMTCSCPNYGNVKAIQCAHIQRACSEYILSHPTDNEMQERIVEMKSAARKVDNGRHQVALTRFRMRQQRGQISEEAIARRESSAAYRHGRQGELERVLTEARLIELMQNPILQIDASVPAILQDTKTTVGFTPEKRLPKKPPTEPVRRKFDFDP